MVTDDYDAIARNVGKYLVPVALLLWGMTAARARSLRPGANSRAFRSLFYGLGTWVLLLLFTSFAPLLPWLARVGVVAVMAGLGVRAAVLGVGGLLHGHRGERAVLPALGGILIGLGLAGSVSWFTASRYFAERARDAQPPPPGHLADFAFRVSPPAGWRVADAKRMNANARLAYVRIRPTMAFLVLADNAPPGKAFEIAGLLDYVRTTVGATQETPVRDEAKSIGGRDGVLLAIDSAGPGREFHYSAWVSATESQAIIALVSARSSAAPAGDVAAEARRVFDTIQFR